MTKLAPTDHVPLRFALQEPVSRLWQIYEDLELWYPNFDDRSGAEVPRRKGPAPLKIQRKTRLPLHQRRGRSPTSRAPIFDALLVPWRVMPDKLRRDATFCDWSRNSTPAAKRSRSTFATADGFRSSAGVVQGVRGDRVRLDQDDPRQRGARFRRRRVVVDRPPRLSRRPEDFTRFLPDISWPDRRRTLTRPGGVV